MQVAVVANHTIGIASCAAMERYFYRLLIYIAVDMFLTTITLRYVAMKKSLYGKAVCLAMVPHFIIHRLICAVIADWYSAPRHEP